jgi:drug/metabolite transporter (DMT)-like permease
MDHQTNPDPAPFVTFLIVAGSSLFFCSKGVFAKSAYGHGADPLTILALRMLVALPFFAVSGLVTSPRDRQPMGAKMLWALIGLGFVGYYLSSLVNFTGLQYISVGLERMVLYTYPTLVLFGSAVFLKRSVTRSALFATGLAYLGIIVGFTGEAKADAPIGDVASGVALVFLSAVTYASFMLCSGRAIRRLGAIRFTSIVVGASCFFMLAHFAIARDLSDLLALSGPVYLNGLILGVFGTVVPSFLLGIGLQRAGATKFAVIGCIGPIGTVFLAWIVLGETMNGAQMVGLGLTIAGGALIAIVK